uniref:Uncharacterized protein n=1 Tax=Hyaloperonospora arabidopsidis (strain Emoy2) TaxID=559515 RepID=M4BU08_HYAAE
MPLRLSWRFSSSWTTFETGHSFRKSFGTAVAMVDTVDSTKGSLSSDWTSTFPGSNAQSKLWRKCETSSRKIESVMRMAS